MNLQHLQSNNSFKINDFLLKIITILQKSIKISPDCPNLREFVTDSIETCGAQLAAAAALTDSHPQLTADAFGRLAAVAPCRGGKSMHLCL